MEIIKQINYLKQHYQMAIPQEYVDFISKTDFFDYADTMLSTNGMEIELNHFLKEDDEYPSRDLLSWYSYAAKEREDYLTIAMGYGNEEIAIKVKGRDCGGVYYIEQTEETTVKKLYHNFNELKKYLTKEN